MKLRPLVVALAVFSCAGLVACSSPAPEPTLYLLRSAPGEGVGRVDASPRIGLGRVVLAPYLLASPGIVVETEPGVVRPGNQHQWAEPLDSALRWYLRTQIGRALGYEVGGGMTDVADWDFTIDLYVARLHGTMEGNALIESGYVIRPRADRRNLSEYHFSKSVPLPEAGYAGLVAAQQQLLTELADAIAEGVKTAAAQRASEEGVEEAPAP